MVSFTGGPGIGLSIKCTPDRPIMKKSRSIAAEVVCGLKYPNHAKRELFQLDQDSFD